MKQPRCCSTEWWTDVSFLLSPSLSLCRCYIRNSSPSACSPRFLKSPTRGSPLEALQASTPLSPPGH